ncbi:MAG: DUF423 domain-containing protein [Hyphomonadaceae bacterium]
MSAAPTRFFPVYAAAAAALAGLAVAAGAFAAHAAPDERTRVLLETGARYQFLHALGIVAALAFWRWGGAAARHAPPLFLLGTALFSGSLYALAAGAPGWAGVITPLGGLCFLAGWAMLAWAGARLRWAGAP